MKLVYLISLIFIISTYFVVNGQLSTPELNIVKAYHDKWRSSPKVAPATPIPLLRYNTTIASALQTSLNKCDGSFSSMNAYGQNSEWQSWWTPYTYFNLNATLNNIENGAAFYDWTAKGCNSTANYNCQLWTTAVWSKTTSFGCAKSICPGANRAQISCSYYPAGGYKGVLPYTPKTSTPAPTTAPPATTKPPTTPPPTTKPPTTPPPTTKPPTTTQPPTTKPPTTTAPPATAAPSKTVDWTNYLTPVRNQGQCGSCWSFASTANLESRYLLKNGLAQKSTLQLSNQNAVNCVPNGCNGGWATNLFNFFKTPGIAYEKDDVYKGVTDTTKCVTTSSVPRFKFTGFVTVDKTKDALIAQLKNGPLTIALFADGAFQSYRSGIFKSATKYTSVNHAVLLVGYDQATDAWKIKNSWGTTWGESGFIRVVASDDNLGILLYNSYYPTL